MRNYAKIDKYLDVLIGDAYPQPEDEAHTAWAGEYLHKIQLLLMADGVSSVLDVGCGTGFCTYIFESMGINSYTGVTWLGDDAVDGRNIVIGDMMFLEFDDELFDVVLARHILEHSPAPLLALMEWRRVSKKYLALVLPAPDYWGYGGKNHYSVMDYPQIWWLLRRAGWEIIYESTLRTSDDVFMKYYMPENQDRSKVVFPGNPKVVEYQFLCKKVEEIIE